MRNKSSQVWLHITACLIFLSLPFFFSPDGPYDLSDFFHNPRSWWEIFRYLLLVAFFYFNYFVLVPHLFFPQKYVQYAAASVICFFVIALLPSVLIPQPVPPFPIERMNFPRRTQPNWIGFNIRFNIFPFLALLFFSLMLKITTRWRQTEKEKMATELSYLKAQVNPHFLFNTLNSIYALAIDKSDDAPTAVVKLSGMMRYVLTDATHDFVPLEKEISYITDFVELQQLRFGDSVPVHFTVNGSTAAQKIAPLVLIAFVENAFKYGVNAEEDMLIKIEIDIHDSQLQMKVFNRKVNLQHDTDTGSGLGIANTKNRLELLYPSKHELVISKTDKQFKVFLILYLQ